MEAKYTMLHKTVNSLIVSRLFSIFIMSNFTLTKFYAGRETDVTHTNIPQKYKLAETS